MNSSLFFKWKKKKQNKTDKQHTNPNIFTIEEPMGLLAPEKGKATYKQPFGTQNQRTSIQNRIEKS